MPNPASQTSTTVDDLIAKDEILGVLHRYCHSCDRLDAEALASCFHPDSITDHAGVQMNSLEWIPHALGWLAPRVAVTHMIANPMIQVAGDRAISDCHFVAYNRSPKADGKGWDETLVKGRYLDRLERRDDVWKIIRRTGVHDLERVTDAPAGANDVAGEHRSGKAPGDPYYALLAGFQAG